jgi:transposase
MHLRRCTQKKGGKEYCYWQLVESYRTERGPRQRVVAHLGDTGEAGRLGVKAAAKHLNEAASVHQPALFDEVEPEWTEVDTSRIRVENIREFGAPWLGLEVLRKLELPEFLQSVMPKDRAAVDWANMALVLILARLCEPSSELHIAEHYFEQSGLSDLLGIPADRVNDDRLYRTLDQLLPHKEALERHLKERIGQLFDISYDLLLYDMTSTYFEGKCEGNPEAQRGYSRDHRGDCKQVTIALVVTRDGLPLGYQVFNGSRADVTTVGDVVERIEKLYGQANRIWVMDRGMVSQENVDWLRRGGRRYILGTPKGQLRKFEVALTSGDWKQVHEGLEVKLCRAPDAGDLDGDTSVNSDNNEVFILCRSVDRQKKEEAMHDLFIQRIEGGLDKLKAACEKRKQDAGVVERRIGRLLGNNTRAEALFEVQAESAEDGWVSVRWTKKKDHLAWARLSEGSYLLRSNITDWSPEELWKAYIQLTQAENAFRIHKQDLSLRPIWHQRSDRVQTHILVCFLAYVVWKTLGMMCRKAGLGDEPRKVLQELKRIGTVDVVMPTRRGIELRRRYIAQPSKHQAILLQQLGLKLPRSLKMRKM